MLPFLKPKKMSSVIIAKSKPDGGLENESVEGEMDQGLLSAAEDMLSAIKQSDSKAFAEALQSAFEMMESQPHEEGDEEAE